MKFSILIFSALLGLILTLPLVAPSRCAAAEPGEMIVLFDGKTLDGWHKNPQRIGHGTGGEWTVEDGAIVGQQDPPGSGNGGILLTDRKFGDFELSIDLKPDWGICSGLFLRSTEKGQCLQMMVDYHDNGDVGHIYGEGLGGFSFRPFDITGVYDQGKLVGLTTKPSNRPGKSTYSISGADWVQVWKINDWNTARVRVVGNPPEITTWINGTKICDWNGATFDGPKYDKKKVTETLGAEGHIAVQVHGGKSWPVGAKCRWKNIQLKPL